MPQPDRFAPSPSRHPRRATPRCTLPRRTFPLGALLGRALPGLQRVGLEAGSVGVSISSPIDQPAH